MSEFVDECRREWKRLGVPDPIANEMAVDLAADIAEAEAEGGSAEDVLGDSVFDARRFAASWAGARGVISQREPVGDRPRRLIPAIALCAVAGILALGALVLVVGRHSSSSSIAVRRFLAPPVAPAIQSVTFGPQLSGPHQLLFAVAALALMLFAFGMVVLAVVLWKPWKRDESSPMNRLKVRNR
jgi:hypothetical protein